MEEPSKKKRKTSKNKKEEIVAELPTIEEQKGIVKEKEENEEEKLDKKKLEKMTVKELKVLGKQKGLLVSGSKDKIIGRLLDPDNPLNKRAGRKKAIGEGGKGEGTKRKATVDKWLESEGVDPNSISKCAFAGLQRGRLPMDLKAVAFKGKCESCNASVEATVKDLIHQHDDGDDYEDGDEGGGLECKDCENRMYVTNLCKGIMEITSGKYHHHCTKCKGMGKCVGDVRVSHCNKCGSHYFAGTYGFNCDNCERNKEFGGFGGFGRKKRGFGATDDCIIF